MRIFFLHISRFLDILKYYLLKKLEHIINMETTLFIKYDVNLIFHFIRFFHLFLNNILGKNGFKIIFLL